MSKLLECLEQKKGIEKADAFYNYMRKKAWERGIPLIGCFELTPRCTLNCAMCYVHLKPGQMHCDELSAGQWIDLIDQSCEAGMMHATLTGGECLMHPGFKEIYEHLQARGILVTVLTNGTLLDEKTVAWMRERPPEQIQISVYGSSPEGYRAVTGSAEAFLEVDRAIDLVKDADLPFNLAITLSRQIVNDFEAVLRYCRSKEPFGCNVTAFPFEPRVETGRKYDDYSVTLDDMVKIAGIRLKMEGKTPAPYSCEADLLDRAGTAEDRPFQNVKGVRCTAGRIRFSISWNGKMTPCNALDFVQAFPLESGFAAAWDTVYKRSCEYRMPKECDGCLYNRVCVLCPAVHWLAVGEGRANPRVCAEGKRMALEGIRKL
jgi:radical SAM protein with 4Fe4S-binding SPASM domain